ncbi:MAG: hypothetical protein JST65_02090, partial [Acidobacteria bacterium]|nr:hypothetical protein [Acidobacteriota bacterium]
SLVADEKHWQPFMSIYVDIISRAPLVAKAEDKKLMAALTEITSVKVQKLTTPAGATHRPGKTFQFRIAWTFYKDASQTFDISSDIWLPDVPVKRTFPALKQTTDNATGAVSVETYESKTFF